MQAGPQEPVAKRYAKKAEGLIECSLADYLAANPRAKTTDRAGEKVKDTEIVGFAGYKVNGKGHKALWWKVRCSCGDEFLSSGNAIATTLTPKRAEEIFNCGGVKHLPIKVGDQVGRLTIERIWNDGRWYVDCSCSCGAYPTADGALRTIQMNSLAHPEIQKPGRSGTSSCGCYLRESTGNRSRTHGASTVRDTEPARYKAFVMISSAKQRAKKAGVPFDLNVDDLVPLPEVCPVLEIPLDLESEKLGDNSATLDRLVPTKGYVRGNVVVISHRANKIKTDASPDEIEAVAAWLRKQLNSHK